MQITINGAPHEYNETLSIADLLAVLGLDMRKVAFERNREIVSRSAYNETHIADGDAIEIVHFIGGG